MIICKDIAQWNALRAAWNTATLGFIPTMGALHEGHMSLVKASQQQNEKTVVSIFVNPTQFNDPKDFSQYPNLLDQDCELLSQQNVDALLLPKHDELYADQFQFQVQENELSKILCGKFRPGHFTGVLTVVMKLLQVVQANRAYFGEKDYQQYLLIKKMVAAFFMKTDIIGCPTVREPDGLAMSSRNLRFTVEQRERAALLHKFLSHPDMELSDIAQELTLRGFKLDYLEEHWNRRFVAAHLGEVRLIDNVAL